MEKYFQQFVKTATKEECYQLAERLESQGLYHLKRLLEKATFIFLAALYFI